MNQFSYQMDVMAQILIITSCFTKNTTVAGKGHHTGSSLPPLKESGGPKAGGPVVIIAAVTEPLDQSHEGNALFEFY